MVLPPAVPLSAQASGSNGRRRAEACSNYGDDEATAELFRAEAWGGAGPPPSGVFIPSSGGAARRVERVPVGLGGMEAPAAVRDAVAAIGPREVTAALDELCAAEEHAKHMADPEVVSWLREGAKSAVYWCHRTPLREGAFPCPLLAE